MILAGRCAWLAVVGGEPLSGASKGMIEIIARRLGSTLCAMPCGSGYYTFSLAEECLNKG
jgi:hypothetical protein